VWLDAPVGYMASFKNLCASRKDLKFDDYWGKDSKHDLYHFIGKDITYFHTLFWPAMLHGAGFRTPTAVFVHGFLTVNGQKMSKSRGTFIKARTYLDHLNPEYLRYYFAAKLGPGVDDIDLNLDDFTQRINADLVGKYVNIASRSAGFIHDYFQGGVKVPGGDSQGTAHKHPLLHEIQKSLAATYKLYEARQFGAAITQIMKAPTTSTPTGTSRNPGSWPSRTNCPSSTKFAAWPSRPSSC